MVWIILIICFIGYFIYFLRKRDQMLQRQVDINGGMAKKYEYLIESMTNEPGAKVIKVTRDHILIRLNLPTASRSFFYITENFNLVRIEIDVISIMTGTLKHKWEFDHDFPQEKMVEEIQEFIQGKAKEMFNNE